MNLQKLFEAQKKLDEHIIREKGLEGQDLLDKKILALQVELGELANEWRGFKFWSENQEPREFKTFVCPACKGTGKHYKPITWDCRGCSGTGIKTKENPLLEEYVDCLHFILSIGLEHEEYLDPTEYQGYVNENDDIDEQFNQVFRSISFYEIHRDEANYYETACQLIGLGEMLGFTWEQVEQAYFKKNKINHQRQESGY